MVAALWAVCLVGLVLWALLGGPAGIDAGWWVLYAVWLLPFVVLRSMTRGVAERPVARLDEREAKLRGRYLAIGYYTALCAGFAVAVYLVALSHADPTALARGAQLLLVAMGMAAAVPTVALGWTAPDDDPEDLETA
ncbi:hypothetical protein EFW17_09175 [Halostreptopolyspora alba]|uniref:DUF2178 domain-containing protein n=1 Tax=Halostreptopolyspora alba TaxID=2487137 RepID=A0A3N0EBN7_9ACTN|nr:hypothetical protein EFW17_09175 [Nocardiopsaceae bacterium YIM 96095]